MSNTLPVPSLLWLLQRDPALQQDAAYTFSDQDRAAIDSQNQAVQTHLLQSLLLGATATWMPVDSGSAPCTVGTAVCLAGSVNGTVTLATAGALAASGSVFGVVVKGGTAGQFIRIVTRGYLPPSVTGLNGTSGVYCIVTGSGVLTQASSISAGQYVTGTVDGFGNINVFAQLPPVGGSGGSVTVGYSSVVSKSASFTAVANTYYLITAGAPITVTMPTMTVGQIVGGVDLLGESGTNNITWTPPGAVQLMNPANIGGPTAGVYGTAGTPFVANTNGAAVAWMSDGATHYSNY